MLPVSIQPRKKERPKVLRQSKLPKTPRFYNGSIPENKVIPREYNHFKKASEL